MRNAAFFLVLAALLVATAPPAPAVPSLEATHAACSVPCGYIYPLILIRTDTGREARPIAVGETIEIPATLTYRFDVANEGYTLPDPQQPIVVSFEYPRRPAWAHMSVDPPTIDIPVQPQYIEPDASDPNAVQAFYVYTTDITISVRHDGDAVLPDGFDYAKLLVFAKSTESGLYKSGYGIKEVRFAPAGAVHASDVAQAGPRVVVDAGTNPLVPVVASAPGLEVTLTPGAPTARLWQPTPFVVNVETPAGDAIAGRGVATLVTEDGSVAYSTGWRALDAAGFGFNLTLPGPGTHVVAVHVEPADAAAFVPRTLALPVTVGPDTGDAVRMPREYRVSLHETVTTLRPDPDEAVTAFEKTLPFFAAPGASSAALTVSLRSATSGLPSTVGNLNVQMLGPEGGVIAQTTVDAANPVRAIPVGALPGDGWFSVRVSGLGVPDETAFDVGLSVNYPQRPVVVRSSDGVLDARAEAVGVGRFNVTFTAGGTAGFVTPWAPADLAVSLTRDDRPVPGHERAAFTVVGGTGTVPEGRLVYASGVRVGDDAVGAAFTPPAPGRFTGLALVQPGADAGVAFDPFIVARSIIVGDPSARTVPAPATFALADAGTLSGPVLPERAVVEHLLPAAAGDGDVTVALAGGSPADAARVERVTDGDATYVRVLARVAQDADVTLTGALPLALGTDAVDNPSFNEEKAPPKSRIPGLGVAAALGVVAVVAAASRRRAD